MPLQALDTSTPAPEPLAAWAAAIASATDLCVLLDARAALVAASVGFAQLVGAPVAELAGRPLFPEILQVLDFSDGAPVSSAELGRTPPLLALSAGVLARSLLRVRRADRTCLTLDAVSTPVAGRDGIVAGSVTFIHTV